jgi:nucleoid-associated protein YgaU
MFAKLIIALIIATIAVAIVARTSSGHGPERTYVVRPADTLWTIAVARYGGDPREGVWRIQERNHLEGTLIRPGDRLVLP